MISLYDILESAQGQLFGEPAAKLFSSIALDPRRARESSLFAALRTDEGDGHSGMLEAVAHGATGILCTRPPDFDTEGLSIILVKDTLAALMSWSHYVLGRLGTQVIGIAGLSGKSITAEAIRAVLGTRYAAQSGVNLYRGRLNIPLTIAQLTSDHRFVTFELDASQPGEMATMVQAVRPQVGVISRLGTAETDRFETPEQFSDEIGLLLDYLSPTNLAVLNYDDDRVRSLHSRTRADVITVGVDGFGADMMAYNLIVATNGMGFDLRFRDQRFVGRWTPLLGKHHLYAVLSGLAVGTHFDVPLEESLRALTEMQALPGRMKPHNGIDGTLVIDDSYRAEPTTTRALLDWIQDVTDERQRTIFVFGDMDPLGLQTQRSHRQTGQHASEIVDYLIVQGADAALAGRAALDHGMDPSRIAITYSPQDTIARLHDIGLSSSDVIVVKGGQQARMELVVRALLADPDDVSQLPRADLLDESEALIRPNRPSWVEINQTALADNILQIKKMIGDEVALFAVVKADAYGHGAVSVARTALINGAEYLAVANLQEAIDLRDAGIRAPILCMSYVPPQNIREAVHQDITVTVYELELARAYDRVAQETGSKLKVHAKVDTGMGRIGVLFSQAMPFFRHLLKMSGLEVEGVYTHFSSADSDPEYTALQVKRFKELTVPLRAAGFRFKYVHAANSAGMLASPDNHFNAVRIGLAMYGLSPSETVRVPETFRPVLSWKTVVAQVKTLPAEHPVGYGNTYKTRTEERIAVIPVGYADGFRRAPYNWGQVLVRGQFAPVIGRVSMEKTVINVNHIPDVSIGDEVVLLGTQGENRITADDVAERWGTISYEVVCSVLPRIPRR